MLVDVTVTSREVSRVGAARAVVLVILLMNVAWALVLPAALVDPPGAWATAVVGLVLGAHALAHLLVVRAAVSPWVEAAARQRLAGALVAATLLAWPALFAWAEPGEESWAWLAGFTIGSLPLVLGVLPATAAGAGLLGMAAAGAVLWDGSVGESLLFTVLAASAAGLFAAIVVWMLRLLVEVEAGRSAQAGLAVAEERLRFARELHDTLGHRLNVIGLKAELAGETEIQELATATLRDVRQAVHGYATLDLEEQVQGAALVLGSAGVEVTVESEPVALSPASSQFLASAVREAVTNVLQHSDARSCQIVLSRADSGAALTVVNDRPHPAGEAPGIGLMGLAERGARIGARLTSGIEDSTFRLRVEVAS